MSVEQQYIDLFSQTEAMICRHSAEALNAPRAAAFADFERLGFPTRKTEKYKYTDVSKFFEPDYGLNLNRLEIPVNPYEVFKCDVPNMSTSLYFVVNDAFYNKALPKSHLPEGVIFGSLKEMAEQRPELVKKYYGKLADTSKDGVTAFNTAFAQDGVLLYVPKNVVVEKPIQLVNILRGDVNFMVNRRVLIILEEGAQARLLACDHAMDSVNFLATQVVEVFVGENRGGGGGTGRGGDGPRSARGADAVHRRAARGLPGGVQPLLHRGVFPPRHRPDAGNQREKLLFAVVSRPGHAGPQDQGLFGDALKSRGCSSGISEKGGSSGAAGLT